MPCRAAVVFCLDKFDEYEHISCGTRYEVSRGLAEIVARVVGYAGNSTDGTPRKLLDRSVSESELS
jgi:GDP-L-fucose synthase